MFELKKKLCMPLSEVAGVRGNDAVGGGTMVASEGIPENYGVNPTGGTHEVVEAAGLHEIDYEKAIVKIRPSIAPLDTLVRDLGATRVCKSIETGAFEVGTRDIIDHISEAADKEISSVNGTAKTFLTVGKQAMWLSHDTAVLQDVEVTIGGNPVLKDIGFYITDVRGDEGKIGGYFLLPEEVNGKNIKIKTASTIQRTGTAVNELTALVEAINIYPVPRTNYCQTFMSVIEEGILESKTLKKAAIDFSTYKEQELWDFRRKNESAFMFGFKSRTRDEKGRLVHTCDGVWNQVTKQINLTGEVNNDLLDEMMRFIFTNQNGSERKVLLAGHGLLSNISKALRSDVTKILQPMQTEVVAGLKFNRIETNHGEILIRPHELFRGTHYYDGIVLDPAFIMKEYLEPLQTKKMNLDDSGQARANVERIHETSCIVLKNLPTHCRIVSSLSSDPIYHEPALSETLNLSV